MASVYDLKPKFQALLRPLVRALAAIGVTPNALTLTALAGSIAVGAALILAPERLMLLLLLPAWLLVRMALNALDGMMARELGMATPLGAVLNELGDVLSDLALYLPLAAFPGPARWAVVAFATGAVLTEFCGLLTQTLGGGRRYEGPMGKSDRAFVAGALALATAIRPGLLPYWPWVLGAGAALAALTCWNRLRKGLAARAGA
jgi:CDP-diacylglycerol---glycerol-3-phosphate 3-phosphatidyltransferase